MQYETPRPIGFSGRAFFCSSKIFFQVTTQSLPIEATPTVVVTKGENKSPVFGSFCKKVLRKEARDYYDEMKRQRDREVSFSELSAQEMDMLFVMDKYPSEQLFNYSKRKMTLVFSVGMCYTGVSNLFCVDCCSGREVGVFILAEF